MMVVGSSGLPASTAEQTASLAALRQRAPLCIETKPGAQTRCVCVGDTPDSKGFDADMKKGREPVKVPGP
jgi:hypothetical protein